MSLSVSSGIFKSGVIRRTLVAGAVVTGVALLVNSNVVPHASVAQSNQAQAQAVTPAAQPAAQPIVRGLPDFTELVDRVGPSVVNIRTTERVQVSAADESDDPNEQMQEFMRRFFGGQLPGQPAPRKAPKGKQGDNSSEERPRGVGSGFIITNDGYVMTNAHVVDGADEVYVTLTDKRELKAKVVGVDKRTDVAVVKIDANNLPALRVGEVRNLKVGEWVMAIGSPFGLENTVTAGIVSAKARDTGEEIRFIQTDVAVNPGNSGGPLINMRGEVVGINSQILSRSGGFMGISFSIPIDDAMKVADQLRANGKVIRGRIGVQIEPVTKDVADSLGLSKAQGAVVRMVEPGGPADKAGIEAGDIITKFAGQPVEKAGDLPRLVGGTKPGTQSVIQVFRRGAYKDLKVSVVQLDADKPATPGQAPSKGESLASSSLGLSLTDLTNDKKRELKIGTGVLVDGVDGPAARAGLREGDVILAIGNVQIADVKQFEAVLAKVDRKRPVSVLVRRGEWAQYAVIRPAN
jgi:serine protease Do